MLPDRPLLGRRYDLLAPIATGGTGRVWRARDTLLGRDVAVKVLRPEYTANATFLARFRAEAQHSAGLLHPAIATLFDYGEVPPDASPDGEHLAYLVMELVRGESLSMLLRRERRLSPERTLAVLRECAAGLAAAHAAGVVHRDVKPGNVLLGDDGAVKLTDFGIALSASSVPLTVTGEVVGTAHYLSPEQAAGERATPASDVYALGLVSYECLAGHRGYDGGDAVEVALRRIREVPPPLPDDVPAALRRLIDRAITKDPAQRFADGAALRAAVEDVLAGRPAAGPADGPRTLVMPAVRMAAPPPPPPRPPSPAHEADEADEAEPEPAPHRRWPFLLAAVLTFLVVAGGTSGLLQLATDRGDQAAAAAVRPSPTPASAAPTEPAVRLVSLSTADYVGRPVAEVQAELAERGMVVTLRPLQTGDVPDGQVIALYPVGQVLPGAAVDLTHAVAPPPPPPPPPAPAPAPVPAPTEAVDEPDDGRDDGWHDDRHDDRDDGWHDDRDGHGDGDRQDRRDRWRDRGDRDG
ncbi:protein kinase domain-containing protein [Modestobacter roseus]|uniref:protein kinase domain-containing protein n=1 Tax=Modestobacter roseus TaxID=1181884 RepID=UPI0034DF1714